ncbi:nitroreductase family protein [Stenotrophomonas sp. CFBP 13718]|uniref:nitroreductase family protein n=1 Tax=Stenotrophomonas sp. CFBP 13718 TaxID=2775304 RepID=UPI001785ED5B|nr:nitroreductase family protein [Stenotrophomonas sp. CFBP 13718]MBD8695907.1 nitroreductase family protein [Stenotrophomonas sp. CFBP 13718]
MTHPIITAIEERRTTVLFDTTRVLSDAQIQELVRLATRAPTSFNLQNWRFIAVRTQDAKARLRAIAWDQVKITDAAVTFIICGQLADEKTLPDRLAPVVEAGIMPEPMVAGWVDAAAGLYAGQPWRQRDEAVRTATFGAATLIFAAHAMGLGAGPMIGFDQDAVARDFDLAANEIPVMLLSVGFPIAGNWPQKPRRPMDDVLTLV